MNYISVAQETKKIIRNREYEINGKTIKLPELDYEEVDVISPQLGEELLAAKTDNEKVSVNNVCIVAEDSFQAAKRYDHPLVMNFANAHNPGGGFELGATAQEEALFGRSRYGSGTQQVGTGSSYSHKED